MAQASCLRRRPGVWPFGVGLDLMGAPPREKTGTTDERGCPPFEKGGQGGFVRELRAVCEQIPLCPPFSKGESRKRRAGRAGRPFWCAIEAWTGCKRCHLSRQSNQQVAEKLRSRPSTSSGRAENCKKSGRGSAHAELVEAWGGDFQQPAGTPRPHCNRSMVAARQPLALVRRTRGVVHTALG